jgi:hypothetical protein
MNQLKLQRQVAERVRTGEEYGAIATALGVSRPTARNALRLYKDYEQKLASKKPLERAALARGRILAEARTDFVDAIEALAPVGRDVQDILDLRRKIFDSNTEPALFNSMVEVINLFYARDGQESPTAAALKLTLVEAFPVPEPEPEEAVVDAEFAPPGSAVNIEACEEGACSPAPWVVSTEEIAEPGAHEANEAEVANYPVDLGGEG